MRVEGLAIFTSFFFGGKGGGEMQMDVTGCK